MTPRPTGHLASGAMLRALLSFGAAFTASWAFTVAIGLVAYANGGALAVGLVAVLRLVPAALLAPVIATYADRMPRERVLFASSTVRGVATLAIASILQAGGPVLAVYGLAVVSSIAFTPFRASHSALLPSLCRTPDQLTSANVARGALDSASLIIGPLVAALLLAVADLAAVFAFAGVCAVISALLVLRLRYERIPLPGATGQGLVAEIRDGLAAVRSNAGVGVVVGLVALQAAIRGAFTVFVVVLVIDLLGGTQAGVGVITGAVGVGALVGSLLCSLLVGSRAMARWLGLAIVLWGAPLAIMGLLPHETVALLAAGVIGIGNALVDVSAFTLIARMTPNAVLARVFGVLESLGALAVGLGSLAAPLLIAAMGATSALLVVGVLTPVVCMLWWRRLTAIDRVVTVRTDDIMLLRQVPMLRPLPVPVLEELANGVVRTDLEPGETLFEAGDAGDSFYVVADGTVQVLDRDRVVRTMGRGEGFGEIALLEDGARTMTVRALGPVELCGISSGVFIPAVTSMSDSSAAAEATARSHLDNAPGRSEQAPDST